MAADDNTKSFKQREEAIAEVIRVQSERAALETKIAKEQFDIAKLAIKNDFIRRGQLEKFQALEEAGAIRSLKFLEDKKNADIIGIENLNKLTEASLGLTEAQAREQLQAEESNKIIAELKQDRLERDLDILIDGFDNQKTINERLIADERSTFDERQKLLDETTKLADESFRAHKDVLAELSAAGIDVNELLGLAPIELNKRIRELEQSEIIEGRTLEVVRERRTVLQDLVDVQKDLNEAKLASSQAIAEAEQSAEQDTSDLRTELLEKEAEQDETTLKRKKEIVKEIYENERDAIEDQADFDAEIARQTITDKEELAARLIEIETIKNNDIKRLEEDTQKEITDIQAAAQDERLEKGIETANTLIDLTSEAIDKAADEQEQALEESIARREEAVSRQQKRAEEGLENQLAFEKQKLAQQERERAELAEKRAKAEEAQALAQAFLNAFQARVKDDPNSAAAKALTDVVIAKALSETIAGAFAEGVEDFQGEGTGTSDSNLIRFSHGESVVTAKGTKENKGLVTAMNNGDVGSWFASNMMLTPLSKDNNYDSFGVLAQKIDSIEKAIKNRPTSQTNLDNMGNVIQSTYRNGIKNTVKYVNKPGII